MKLTLRINIGKNATHPLAIDELKAKSTLAQSSELRQNKYLNNQVKQDHRFIKKLVNPGLGFKSFHTARTNSYWLRNYEYGTKGANSTSRKR